MNTGTVTINGVAWVVEIATTYTELTTGLSGVVLLPASHGMLFDLGDDYLTLDIYLAEMLFPIDAVFISADGTRVVDLTMDMLASENTRQIVLTGGSARYFMEVNAGELDAAGVEMNNDVAIVEDTSQGPVQPTDTTSTLTTTMNSLIPIIMLMLFTKYALSWAMKPSSWVKEKLGY